MKVTRYLRFFPTLGQIRVAVCVGSQHNSKSEGLACFWCLCVCVRVWRVCVRSRVCVFKDLN